MIENPHRYRAGEEEQVREQERARFCDEVVSVIAERPALLQKIGEYEELRIEAEQFPANIDQGELETKGLEIAQELSDSLGYDFNADDPFAFIPDTLLKGGDGTKAFATFLSERIQEVYLHGADAQRAA